MTRWLMACLASLTLAPAAIEAPATDPPQLSIKETLALCRAIYFSDDPTTAIAAWKALPEDEQASVALICLAYRQGARDLMRASEPAEQPRKG